MSSGDHDKIGFGGFNELVSDVAKDLEVSIQKSEPQISSPPNNPTPPATAPIQAKTPDVKGNSTTKWFWGIAAVVVVISIINSGNNEDLPAPEAAPGWRSMWPGPPASGMRTWAVAPAAVVPSHAAAPALLMPSLLQTRAPSQTAAAAQCW